MKRPHTGKSPFSHETLSYFQIKKLPIFLGGGGGGEKAAAP